MTLVAAPRAHAAGQVSIVDGADDPVQVTAGEKKERYFRVAQGDGRLVVTAEGPVVLSVRVRALRPGRCAGALRIVRDDGPFSDTPYDLERDYAAAVETSAAAEENAASLERVLHVQVPDGEHRFAFSAVKGPSLLVKILKTARFDPKLAAAPERNTAAAPRKPSEEKPREPAEPKRAETQPGRAPQPAAPKSQEPPLPASNRVTAIERAPASLPSVALSPPPLQPAVPERSAGAEAEQESLAKLTERGAAPPKERDGGLAIALRFGGLAFSGFPDGVAPQAGASVLANRVFTVPVALELAWDLDRTWSLFLDASYDQVTREQTRSYEQDPDFQQVTTRTKLRVAPAAFGLTAFVPLGARVGLRLRAGGVLGWVQAQSALAANGEPLVDQPVRQALGFGAVGGLALEVKAGPGRVGLEGRYLLLRTDLGLRTNYPSQPYNAELGDVGGVLLLAGYRLEL